MAGSEDQGWAGRELAAMKLLTVARAGSGREHAARAIPLECERLGEQ